MTLDRDVPALTRLGKQLLGGVMLALGALILSGVDKLFEAWVLRSAPEWLVGLAASI